MRSLNWHTSLTGLSKRCLLRGIDRGSRSCSTERDVIAFSSTGTSEGVELLFSFLLCRLALERHILTKRRQWIGSLTVQFQVKKKAR